MSTSIRPKSNQQYVDFDEYIEYQLTKTRSNIKVTDVLTALVGVAVLVLGYVLLFVVFDHWIISGGFSRATRIFMLGAVLVAAAGWIGWKVVIPYMKRVTGLYAAREIERSSPEMKSTLLNLVDLQQSGRKISEDIQTSLEKRAAVSLSHMNVEEVVDRRPLMRMSYALLAVVVLWCAYSLFSEKKISNSVWRALFPASNVEVATQTEILEVDPGDVELLARSQLKVTADVYYQGDGLQGVRLYYSTTDGRFVDELIEMRPDEDISKRFACVITGENGRGILQDMTYRIESGDARTRDFLITVVQPPSATVESVHYEYPDYMELQPKTQMGGHIDTWEGTKVRISATANMPVTSARLLFSDTDDTTQRAEVLPMQITDGTKLSVTLDREIRLRADGTYPHYYRIECRNEQRQATLDPTLYPVKIRPDKRPDVELLDPVRDLERPANAVVPLLIRAHDPDFKLRSVTLRMEKNGEGLPISIPLFDGSRKSFSTTYRWQLDERRFNFQTGDTVTYWIEARDNKTPTGNRTNTRRMKIDIIPPASEEEVQQQLQQDERRQQEKLEELRQQAKQKGEQQPQDQQDSQDDAANEQQQPAGEQEQKGEQEGEKQKGASSKPEGEQEQKSNQQQQQPGEKQNQQGEEGEGERQSFDPDGGDDEAVTRKLLERFERENREQQSQNNQPGQQDKQPQGNNPDESPMQQESPDPNASGQGEKGEGNQNPQNDAPGESGQPDGKANAEPMGKQNDKSEPGAKGGTPDSSPNKGNKSQPGKGQNETEPDSKSNRKSTDKTAGGKKSPTKDASDPQQEKGTGNETGEGTPDKDPNADPTQVKDNNQIQRKPGEQPSLKKSDSDKKTGEPADLKEKTKQGSPNTGSEKSNNQKQADAKKKQSSGKSDNIQREPTQPTDPQHNVPEVKKKPDLPQGNEDLKSPHQPQGQNDETQQGGEGGSNKPSDQGNSGSKKSGSGDASGKQGDSQQSNQPSGQSGGGKGKGSKSANNQQGDNKSQGGNESSGKGKGSDGKSGSKGGSKAGGKGNAGGKGAAGDGKAGSSGALGSGSSSPTATGGGGASGSGEAGGQGTGGGSGESGSDDANEEYAKKAANLVLNRLEDELKRGEVDQDLLKELGWTEDDLKKFTGRLRDNLRDEGEAETPQSKARKLQFQEWLKTLDLKSTGKKRTSTDRPRRSLESIQGRRTPPPPEFREWFEAYTRGLNKQTNQKE